MLAIFWRWSVDLHQAVEISLIGQGCLPWLIFLVMMMPATPVGTLRRATLPALICHWPPAQNAAVRPAIAAIRAERSILSAQTSVCWTECFSLRLGKWLPSEDVPKTVVFERSVQTQRKSAKV
jgi:hypothetical protein